MTKGTIAKKKGVSKHSRAARRETSPGIDTDKSLKNVKLPAESGNHRPAVLAAHHGAGVSKKSKRKTVLSSKARRRQEKSLDKAEAIMDRTAKKVAQSKGQARTIQSRRKAWDEINQQVPGEKKNPFDSLGDEGKGEDDAWNTDEEMEGTESRTGMSTKSPGIIPSQPPPLQNDGDEQIL